MVTRVPADLEARILERVECGDYANTDEVLRAALEALIRREGSERLRAEIAKGEKGPSITLTPDLVERVRREADDKGN